MSDRFPDEEVRHVDQIDAANHLADLHNTQHVAAARLKAAPEQVQNPDGSWPEPDCVDCGDPIEPVRLKMGKVRCYTCQDLKERKAARGLV